MELQCFPIRCGEYEPLTAEKKLRGLKQQKDCTCASVGLFEPLKRKIRASCGFCSQMARYYDIDDIIMEEELVSVVFQVGANGVGLLDPGAETNNVEQGAKVELPFWLAHELHLRQAVSVNVPPCFNQKTRKEIQADAACVDLRSRCPYFYELGCKVAPLIGDRTIGSFLLYAFTSRYKEVLSKAHSAAFAVAPKFLTLFTKEETHLYEAAQSSMKAFKKWRVGGPRFERASILRKKRKPTE